MNESSKRFFYFDIWGMGVILALLIVMAGVMTWLNDWGLKYILLLIPFFMVILVTVLLGATLDKEYGVGPWSCGAFLIILAAILFGVANLQNSFHAFWVAALNVTSGVLASYGTTIWVNMHLNYKERNENGEEVVG